MSNDDVTIQPNTPGYSWHVIVLRAWCLSLMVFAASMLWRSQCMVPMIAAIPATFWWLETRLDDPPRPTFYVLALVSVVVLLVAAVLGPIIESLLSGLLHQPTFFQF